MNSISPELAWKPLPVTEWDPMAARHLASRLGFSLNPSLVSIILDLGPEGTLAKFFGKVHLQPAPEAISGMEEAMLAMQEQMEAADGKGKRELRQQIQRRNRQSYQDYAVEWYQFARDPRTSAQEKLVLFFQDVWVVAFQGVRSTAALFEYQNLLRRHLGGSYVDMCKALSTSAAMVRYLNLNQNRKGSPNENFARELFELFCLGEGNYTEQDIKEAARATTGYSVNQMDEVRLVANRQDKGPKTIFGKTGRYDLPGLVDLVFEQPAAARFLPQELVRFYLTEEGLPDELLQPLADEWKASGYSIPHLLYTFFCSRIFHDPSYRGNMIKSPVHYYIGLLQDLDLDVFPSPRRTVNQLRTMGQPFFNPPNVRGWVGGRHWINSATLTARRALVQSILYPPDRDSLNADEQRAVERSETAGKAAFSLDPVQIQAMANTDPDELASRLARRFYADPDPGPLANIFRSLQSDLQGRQLGAAYALTTLTVPAYNLC